MSCNSLHLHFPSYGLAKLSVFHLNAIFQLVFVGEVAWQAMCGITIAREGTTLKWQKRSADISSIRWSYDRFLLTSFPCYPGKIRTKAQVYLFQYTILHMGAYESKGLVTVVPVLQQWEIKRFLDFSKMYFRKLIQFKELDTLALGRSKKVQFREPKKCVLTQWWVHGKSTKFYRSEMPSLCKRKRGDDSAYGFTKFGQTFARDMVTKIIFQIVLKGMNCPQFWFLNV